MSKLLAGFSKAALAAPHELIGFGLTSRECKGINDPLMVQSLVLESNEKRVAIITLDLLAIDFEGVYEICHRLASLGFRAEDVLIAASHTHSGPPTIDFGLVSKNRELLAEVAEKAEESARTSLRSLSQASARTGFIEFPHSASRRQRTILGHTKLGLNLKGLVDHQLNCILLKVAHEKTLLLCYGCHPTITRHIPFASADYVYGIRLRAASLGISCAFFLNGALGDVNPYDREKHLSLERAGFEAAVTYGSRMTSEGLTSLSDARDEENLDLVSATTHCEISTRRYHGGTLARKVLLQALKVGPLVLVAFLGEVFSKTALDLKTRLGEKAISIVSCANGYLGYLPPSNEYAKEGYEIMETPRVFGYSVTQGTSEDLMGAAEGLVTSIRGLMT